MPRRDLPQAAFHCNNNSRLSVFWLIVYTIIVVNYSFDPRKLALNVRQHLVWFSEADAFEWETAQLRVYGRRRYAETRFVADGLIGQRL